MARPLLENERQLDVPQTVAIGVAKDVSRFTLNAVQAAGDFAGGWDVDLQGTIDGENWVDIQANIVAGSGAVIDLSTEPKFYALRIETNVVGTLGAGNIPRFFLSGTDDGAWE